MEKEAKDKKKKNLTYTRTGVGGEGGNAKGAIKEVKGKLGKPCVQERRG